jgi:hypothetical protein
LSRTVVITTSLVIGAAIVAAIWFGGRKHENAAPETRAATAPAPGQTVRPYTTIESVDRAIDAELHADARKLQDLVRYASFACGDSGGDALACDPGEKPGTMDEALPVVDCHQSFQRPSEFRDDAITSPGVQLYAVYDASPDSNPHAQYAIVFMRAPVTGASPTQSAFALFMTDAGIVGIDYGCNQTAADLVTSAGLTSRIVAPEQLICRGDNTCDPRSEPVTYFVCAEGSGWTRPSSDDQRRHLLSLGGEFTQFASDPGSLFVGVSSASNQDQNAWHYGLFWAIVGGPEKERYAVARTGLWAAAPDTKNCDRTGELTLLIDRQVTGMLYDGSILWISSRPAPGYFEFVQYTLPVKDHAVSYRLLDENNVWIDGCCT